MVNGTALLLTLLLNVIFFTGLVVQLPDASAKLIFPPMAWPLKRPDVALPENVATVGAEDVVLAVMFTDDVFLFFQVILPMSGSVVPDARPWHEPFFRCTVASAFRCHQSRVDRPACDIVPVAVDVWFAGTVERPGEIVADPVTAVQVCPCVAAGSRYQCPA